MTQEPPAGRSPFAGYAGLLLAFSAGVLCALLPLHYFDSRDAATADANSPHKSNPGLPKQIHSTVPASVSPPDVAPFASRMTYDLSPQPAEAVIVVRDADRVPVDAPDSSPAPRAQAPVSGSGREHSLSTERVADARPIGALAPDPAPRTAEMGSAMNSSQSREQAVRLGTPVATPFPRVFEGREVHLDPRPGDAR
jgi:hypothetical protein